jgi:hypothetical protein
MQLRSISIDPQAIVLKVTANEQHANGHDVIESKITAEEAPLPALVNAFAALPAVFCEIMETGPDWKVGLSVTGLTISRTKHGTRSVMLVGKKQLECRRDFLHPVQTPMVQLDEAADGESGGVQVSEELADIIEAAIEASEDYMRGDRSQQRLDFDKAKDGINALAEKGRKADALQPELV